MYARERELLRAWQRTGDLAAAARLLVDRERRGAMRSTAIDAGAVAGHPAARLARGQPAEAEPPEDVEGFVRRIGHVGDDVALALAARAASVVIIDAVAGLVPQPAVMFRCPDSGQVFLDPVTGGDSGRGPRYAIPAADRLLADATSARRAALLRALWIAPRIADEAAVRAVRAALGTWLLGLPGPRDGALADRVGEGELSVEGVVRAALLRGEASPVGRFGAAPDADAPLALPADLARRGVLGLIEAVSGASPALQAFVFAARQALDAQAPTAALERALEPAEVRVDLVTTNAVAAAHELARSLGPGAPPIHLANALAFARAALHARRTGSSYATAQDRAATHTEVRERIRVLLVAEGRLPEPG